MEQGKAWAQIVSSVIVGAAAVLAAMVPLYCTNKDRLEKAVTKIQSVDTENTSQKQRIAGLEAQIKEQYEQIKKFRGPGGGTINTPGEVVYNDFKFHLNSCNLDQSTVRCDFLVTNQLGDRYLYLLSHSRIIADSADEYPVTISTLGAQSWGSASVNAVLPVGVPVKASLQFGSVRLGTKKIALMEIDCESWISSNKSDFIIKFSNIDL